MYIRYTPKTIAYFVILNVLVKMRFVQQVLGKKVEKLWEWSTISHIGEGYVFILLKSRYSQEKKIHGNLFNKSTAVFYGLYSYRQ